jgi:hypothetical protein
VKINREKVTYNIKQFISIICQADRSSLFKDFLLDVVGDFGVTIYLIDGDKCENVLSGSYFLLQTVVEPQPAEQQHCAVGDAHCQHQGEHYRVVVLYQPFQSVPGHARQLAPVLFQQVLHRA